jgi:hypothetical protein
MAESRRRNTQLERIFQAGACSLRGWELPPDPFVNTGVGGNANIGVGVSPNAGINSPSTNGQLGQTPVPANPFGRNPDMNNPSSGSTMH